VRWVFNVFAVLALVASFVFAWWSSRSMDAPPPAAPGAIPPNTRASPVANPHPAPFDTYAKAAVGDWVAYTISNDSPFGSFPATAITTATIVSATTALTSTRGRLDKTGEIRSSADEQFARANLTLEQLTGADIGNWTLSNIVVTDEPRAVGGRTFPCKHVAYDSRDPLFPTKRTHTDLWVSPEVPLDGRVENHEVQELDGKIFDNRIVLVGFGAGEATVWGARPAGL
jgi:hypothetical protein